VKKLILIVLMPILLSFSTCGRKGDPLPPLSYIPESPVNVKAKQIGKNVLISWNPPSYFIDGRKIKEKGEISYVVRIGFGKSLKRTNTNYVIDRGGKPGEEICYSVMSIYKTKYRSSFSEPICIKIKNPINQFPEIQNATAGDGFVKITFKKSDMRIAVYKSENGKFKPEPYAILEAGINVFVDKNVINKKAYKYFARFVVKGMEGESSEVITLIPEDRFPPEAPENLQIIKKGENFILIWEPSSSKDVKYYEILNNGKVVGTVPYGLYFPLKNLKGCFRIVAVDKAGNRTPSGKVCTEER